MRVCVIGRHVYIGLSGLKIVQSALKKWPEGLLKVENGSLGNAGISAGFPVNFYSQYRKVRNSAL